MANVSSFSGAMPVIPGGTVELGYSEITSSVTVSATSEASGTTVIDTLTFVNDGSPVLVDFSAIALEVTGNASGNYCGVTLWVDGVQTARIGGAYSAGTTNEVWPVQGSRRITGLAAGSHTVKVTAFRTNANCSIYAYPGTTIAQSGPAFLRVSKIVNQNDGLKPFWKPPVVTQFPSNPSNGDEVYFQYTGSGNLGNTIHMRYNGTRWMPVSSQVVARWLNTTNLQLNSTTWQDIPNMGVFTPPWDGIYEISLTIMLVKLYSGIGLYTGFNTTPAGGYNNIAYYEDVNGTTGFHHRTPHTGPIVTQLWSNTSYKFQGVLTYASGNTGDLVNPMHGLIRAIA